jgi:CheY-like chemotaxis protein
LVDDNHDLLIFLERLVKAQGWRVRTAGSAREAQELMGRELPNVAVLDYLLPDGNGVELGVTLRRKAQESNVIVITGAQLTAEEEAVCQEYGFPVLRKPFLAKDLLSLVASRSEGGTNTRGSRALKVFFCYSHRDEKLRDQLDAHLSPLKRMGIIESWHDRKIPPGSDWNDTIDRYLALADLILLLISPDFLNSEYCYRKEMTQALERHRNGDARVIPVIVRPVDWEAAPFAALQAVPRDGKPITSWANRDEGYRDASRAIGRVAEEFSANLCRA